MKQRERLPWRRARVELNGMIARIARLLVLAAGIGIGTALLSSAGSGPAEGPPRRAPSSLSYTGVAVIVFVLAVVALTAWDPGLRRSRAWALRGAMTAGVLGVLALGAAAVHTDVARSRCGWSRPSSIGTARPTEALR